MGQPRKHEPQTHNSFYFDWDRDSIVFALIEKTRSHEMDLDGPENMNHEPITVFALIDKTRTHEMDLDEEGRTENTNPQ